LRQKYSGHDSQGQSESYRQEGTNHVDSSSGKGGGLLRNLARGVGVLYDPRPGT
jgi:hypothetical protein